MFKILNKPYPFNDDFKYNAKVVFFLTIGITAFLFVFQPVTRTDFIMRDFLLFIGGPAGITFVVLSLNLLILPSLFPGLFKPEKWKVKHEIIHNIWILGVIAGSDFLYYAKFLGVLTMTFSDVIKIIFISALPVALLIVVNRTRLLRSHLKTARAINRSLSKYRPPEDETIYLESDYKKDDLKLPPRDIVMIKSAGNYAEVWFYDKDRTISNKMIRSTLNKIEESTAEFEIFFRCHRSYIVNIEKIIEMRGNSQGYSIEFEGMEIEAPVSQKYLEGFKEKVQLIRP